MSKNNQEAILARATRRGGRLIGGRSKVNVNVNYHHHVLHVDHLRYFRHDRHVVHLHIIAYAQCYCFLSNLYNSGLMQLERSKGGREEGWTVRDQRSTLRSIIN